MLRQERGDGPVDADALAVRGLQETGDVDTLPVEVGHLGGHVRPGRGGRGSRRAPGRLDAGLVGSTA
ncbi:hypothetical protein EF912_04800 [Streptomyces sp. WAC07061]|uniref:hypothetical protein n=1 Tax=Streptomyces sp. WAC07061 TaxID=2487410 RepID=UPI000F7B4011|nr:hypothetical protein [Streptomyces sp. WAC07061]RSS62736.1 hypothetical protein EF912_04800 [Streptomyces sp. WAC07061]